MKSHQRWPACSEQMGQNLNSFIKTGQQQQNFSHRGTVAAKADWWYFSDLPQGGDLSHCSLALILDPSLYNLVLMGWNWSAVIFVLNIRNPQTALTWSKSEMPLCALKWGLRGFHCIHHYLQCKVQKLKTNWSKRKIYNKTGQKKRKKII